MRATGEDRFAFYGSRVDPTGGGAHVRYTRTYHGLRVYGGDFVVHTAAGGAYAGTSVGLDAPLTLGTTPKVSAGRGQTAAKSHFPGKITAVGGRELFVDASTGIGGSPGRPWSRAGRRRADPVEAARASPTRSTGGSSARSTRSRRSPAPATASTPARSASTPRCPARTYQMIDPSHGNGTTCDMNNGTSARCTTFTDADNVVGQRREPRTGSPPASTPHYGAAMTFDYFKNVHGRNGIFGNGARRAEPGALRQRVRQRVLGRRAR